MADPTERGFGDLPCLKCGETCRIALDLDDLATFRCGECDEEFTLEDVRTLLVAWQPVLDWLSRPPMMRPVLLDSLATDKS
jgi:hypothetical protein